MWYGFIDYELGIYEYVISLSSLYFGNELFDGLKCVCYVNIFW